jgi:hypothetical protein
MDRYFEKAREEDEAATYHKQRAGASASFERRTFNMATTLRRIQRLEADFRRCHRELDQQELRKKYDCNERSPERAWNIARNRWKWSRSSWITGRKPWRSMRTRV